MPCQKLSKVTVTSRTTSGTTFGNLVKSDCHLWQPKVTVTSGNPSGIRCLSGKSDCHLATFVQKKDAHLSKVTGTCRACAAQKGLVLMQRPEPAAAMEGVDCLILSMAMGAVVPVQPSVIPVVFGQLGTSGLIHVAEPAVAIRYVLVVCVVRVFGTAPKRVAQDQTEEAPKPYHGHVVQMHLRKCGVAWELFQPVVAPALFF